MSTEITSPEDLPSAAGDFARHEPEIWASYTDLGKACSEAGPLEGRERRLIKLALALAAESEGAVHSHVRRAREEHIAPEAIRHVAKLAIPTLGFPKAIAGLSWIDDILEDDS